MRLLTVGQLRAFLAGLPDDMPVMASAEAGQVYASPTTEVIEDRDHRLVVLLELDAP